MRLADRSSVNAVISDDEKMMIQVDVYAGCLMKKECYRAKKEHDPVDGQVML